MFNQLSKLSKLARVAWPELKTLIAFWWDALDCGGYRLVQAYRKRRDWRR